MYLPNRCMMGARRRHAHGHQTILHSDIVARCPQVRAQSDLGDGSFRVKVQESGEEKCKVPPGHHAEKVAWMQIEPPPRLEVGGESAREDDVVAASDSNNGQNFTTSSTNHHSIEEKNHLVSPDNGTTTATIWRVVPAVSFPSLTKTGDEIYRGPGYKDSSAETSWDGDPATGRCPPPAPSVGAAGARMVYWKTNTNVTSTSPPQLLMEFSCPVVEFTQLKIWPRHIADVTHLSIRNNTHHIADVVLEELLYDSQLLCVGSNGISTQLYGPIKTPHSPGRWYHVDVAKRTQTLECAQLSFQFGPLWTDHAMLDWWGMPVEVDWRGFCSDGWVLNVPEGSRSYSSAYWSGAHGHALSTLDSAQAWSARHWRRNEWLQMDLGTPQLVAGVVIQGRNRGSPSPKNRDRNGHAQLVTKFEVHLGLSKGGLSSTARTGRNGTGTNGTGAFWQPTEFVVSVPSTEFADYHVELLPLSEVRRARYVRIVVLEWFGWPSMRAGVWVSPGESSSSRRLEELLLAEDMEESERDSSISSGANKTTESESNVRAALLPSSRGLQKSTPGVDFSKPGHDKATAGGAGARRGSSSTTTGIIQKLLTRGVESSGNLVPRGTTSSGNPPRVEGGTTRHNVVPTRGGSPSLSPVARELEAVDNSLCPLQTTNLSDCPTGFFRLRPWPSENKIILQVPTCLPSCLAATVDQEDLVLNHTTTAAALIARGFQHAISLGGVGGGSTALPPPASNDSAGAVKTLSPHSAAVALSCRGFGYEWATDVVGANLLFQPLMENCERGQCWFSLAGNPPFNDVLTSLTSVQPFTCSLATSTTTTTTTSTTAML